MSKIIVFAFLSMLSCCVACETIVTCDNGLTVYEAENYFTAHGNVSVEHEHIKARADRGRGVVRQNKKMRTVETLSLDGHLEVESNGLHIAADKGIYDLLHNRLTLHGNVIRVNAQDIRAETHGEVVYLPNRSLLKGRQRTILKKDDAIFSGDKFDVVFLKPDSRVQKQAIEDVSYIYVRGDLTFFCGEAIMFASHALYDVPSDKIYAFGEVRVSLETHQLEAPFVLMDRSQGTVELGDTIPQGMKAQYPYVSALHADSMHEHDGIRVLF